MFNLSRIFSLNKRKELRYDTSKIDYSSFFNKIEFFYVDKSKVREYFIKVGYNSHLVHVERFYSSNVVLSGIDKFLIKLRYREILNHYKIFDYEVSNVVMDVVKPEHVKYKVKFYKIRNNYGKDSFYILLNGFKIQLPNHFYNNNESIEEIRQKTKDYLLSVHDIEHKFMSLLFVEDLSIVNNFYDDETSR